GNFAFREQPVQPPKAGAGAVFVHGFHIGVALAGPGGGAKHVDEESLGGGVAVEDVVFATLFIIQDKLHRDMGAAGPIGMGRVGAVAVHVARVAVHHWSRVG